MKNVPWKLVAPLLVLGAATVLVLRQPGETSISGSTGKFLLEYDSAAVDRMEVVSSGQKVVLVKDGGVWMMVEPIRYRADQTAVTEAIGKAKAMEISDPVSTNPEKQRLFQVDSAGALVKISAAGSEKASLRVGKAGSSYSDTYVRLDGSNDVYLTRGALNAVYVRSVRDWRDKTIFKTEKSFIKNVGFRYGDTTFALTLKDSAWTIDGEKTLESVVNTLLGSLSNFTADEFVDSSMTLLPPLTAVLTVDGAEIRFYAEKDGAKYYVKSSQSQQWFEVQKWRADGLLKKKKEFLLDTTKA